MSFAVDQATRFLAELKAAADDAALAALGEYDAATDTYDEYESAAFVINNLPAIQYALTSGMPVTAWAPAQKNPSAGEKVLRAIRQFEEQAKLLILAYTQQLISLDEFRSALRNIFRQQARNSYIAGRRAVGELRPLTPAQEKVLADAVTEDDADLGAGLSLDPTVAAGGGLAAMLGSMLFSPQNYLGSGLPGDPLAGLPAPIGAGKHKAEEESVKAMSKFTNAMSGYGDRIRTLGVAGEVSALAGLPGDSSLVWWTLGYADHCIDCIRLADGSPYYMSAITSNGLYPGAGFTRCGGRCRCSFEYDIPSAVCSDGMAAGDDLSAIVEAADGRRMNVWIMEASGCQLPISIDSLAGDSAGAIQYADDAEAYSWDADVSSLITGSVAGTTRTWAELSAAERSHFTFLLRHKLRDEMRFTKYEASGSKYVAAWRPSGDAIHFHAATVTVGPSVLEPEFTLRALNDLARRALDENMSLAIGGEHLGPGFERWLSTMGTIQRTGFPTPGELKIDWTALGGPGGIDRNVLTRALTNEPKNDAAIAKLGEQPLEQVARAEWATSAEMIDDLTARYPGATFTDLAKLDFELVRPAMQQMDDIFTRFGAIPSFKGVRVVTGKSGVLASVERLNKAEPGSAIMLPKSLWSDRAAVEKLAATQTSASFSTATAILSKDVANIDGYTRAIITHEVGHEYMGINLFSRFGNKGDAVRADVDAWFKTFKGKSLSTYAGKNPHEAWAEAFTAALKATPLHNPKTDELRAIFETHFPTSDAGKIGPLIAAQPAQLADHLTTDFAKWFDSLTPEQESALVHYKAGSEGINDYLRGASTEQQLALQKALGFDAEAAVAAIDAAFNDVPKLADEQIVVATPRMTHPTTVYRGRALDELPTVGDIVADAGYASASIDPAEAAVFAYGLDTAPVHAVYRIALPKGQRAIWTNSFFGDELAHEAEVILPHGTPFRVVAITKDVQIDGMAVSVIDVVPEPKALVPVGPPIPAGDVNSWKPLDPQQYLLPGGGPALNEPLHEWSGVVPAEPPVPKTKATAAELATARKDWDAVKLTYVDVAQSKTDLAISWTAADDKAATAQGLVTGKSGGTYLIAKDQATLDDAIAYLADKTHGPDDTEFWHMLGYDDAAIEKHDILRDAQGGKRLTAGVMVMEPDGRMWVLAPRNKFAGYENTVIKGGVDEGETTAAAAVREALEESGMSVELDAFLGDYTSGGGITRMYVAHRTGGGPLFAAEKETYRVRLLTADEAKVALTQYGKPTVRDQAILADTVEHVLGTPAEVEHIVPAEDMAGFVGATAPLPVEPPAVGLPDRSIIDTNEFQDQPRRAMEVPLSAQIGYDHGTVMSLTNVVDYPPSAKFPIAQSRWTVPGGEVQKVFYKAEAHPGGGDHIFWMNSKAQLADPAMRLNVHVAQLLKFESSELFGIHALRINDALLDQVPGLRELFMVGGAVKPTAGTTELTISQLHQLGDAIKSEAAFASPEAFIQTASLVPDVTALSAAGGELKVTADLLSSVVHEAANGGQTGEFTWTTKAYGKVQTGYAVHPATSRITIMAGDVPKEARLDVIRAQIALLAPKAKADGLLIRLDAFTIDGLDGTAISSAFPGGSFFAGGFHIKPDDAEKLGDSMLHELTAAGYSADALIDGLDVALEPEAGDLVTTPFQTKVPGSDSAHIGQLTAHFGDPGGLTLTSGADVMTWRMADSSSAGTFVSSTVGSELRIVGAKGVTPNGLARQIAYWADTTELHPSIESIVISPHTTFPPALRKWLDPNWHEGEAIHLGAQQVQGMRDSLFPVDLLPHLPTIAPGPFAGSLGYAPGDLIPFTANSVHVHADGLASTLPFGMNGSWRLEGSDTFITGWDAAGQVGKSDGLGQLGFLYDRANAIGTDGRLLVPESMFDSDVVASLVAAGGQRKAGFVVLDQETAIAWQKNAIAEPAALAAAPALVVPIPKPTQTVAEAEAGPLLDMVAGAQDKAATWNGAAMKNTTYSNISGSIVWRRWSNTLEVHDIEGVSGAALKAHIVRMAAAADAAPKIEALRFTTKAVEQMSATEKQLILSAGGKEYSGGIRLTADQTKALRDKLLADTHAAAELPAAAIEPTILSADGVSAINKLTFEKDELKYFDRYTYHPLGASYTHVPTAITQRTLAKEILWARMSTDGTEAERFAAGIKHLLVMRDQLVANAKLERLRFENLDKMPEALRAVLKGIPGSTGTAEVIYIGRDDVLAFAKQLDADLGTVAAVVATPAVSEADMGIVGLAGHDPITLNDIHDQQGITTNIGFAVSKTQYSALGGDFDALWTQDADGYQFMSLSGPAVGGAQGQAVFLHHLDVMAEKASADGVPLAVYPSAFAGQPGQAMSEKLLAVGGQLGPNGAVVLPPEMLNGLHLHIQNDEALQSIVAAIPAPVTPASAGAALSAQYGITLTDAVPSPSPWMYANGSIKVGSASIGWNGAVHMADGSVKLAIDGISGVQAPEQVSAFLASLHTLTAGLPAAGPDGLIVKINAVPGLLVDILTDAGGVVDQGYWIAMDADALAKLASHVDEDTALRTVPKGSAAPNVPASIVAPEATVADIFGFGEEPTLWINASVMTGSKVDPAGGVNYNYLHGEATTTNRLDHGVLTWTKADVSSYLAMDNEAVRSVIVAHLYSTAKMVETGGISSMRIAADAYQSLPGGAWNAVRDVLDDLGGKVVSLDSGSVYMIPLDGLAKFKAAVDNQLLGVPTGVSGIAVEKGLGYSVSDYDKAVGAWTNGELKFSYVGNVMTATTDATIGGIAWKTVMQGGDHVLSISSKSVSAVQPFEAASAVAGGLAHVFQDVIDTGDAESIDLFVNAAVFDHAPQVKQAIIDAIGPEALFPDGSIIVPGSFMEGAMTAIANPLSGVAQAVEPELPKIIPLDDLLHGTPAPSSLVTDYGLELDSVKYAQTQLKETPLTYGFTNYAYPAATVKNRLSGTTLSWESISGGEAAGRLGVGIEHISKMASVLDANPGVKTVRFLKPEQMPASWKQLLTDHGGVLDPEKGIVVMKTDDLKALSKWIDDDLAGKGVIAPSAAVPAPVATVPFHSKYGIDDDLAATMTGQTGTFQTSTWNNPGKLYGGKQTLYVGIPQAPTYGGYQKTTWKGYGNFKTLKSGIRWDAFKPYGSAPTDAEKSAAGYMVLKQLVANAASVNVGLLVPTEVVRAAGVSSILKDAGSVKKALKKGGEELVTLTPEQVKVLSAQMEADIIAVATPIPAAAATITPPPIMTSPTVAPTPAAIVVPPPPVVAATISGSYGYDGAAFKSITDDPSAWLSTTIPSTTPHGNVYVDTWTIQTPGLPAAVNVRWAEEKFGDAFILHVRDVTHAAGAASSVGSTALAASLAKTIAARAAADAKYTSILIDNKAMSDTFHQMLVAAGGKETKGYIRITATQLETLSKELTADTATWLGKPVLSAAGPVPKVSGVKLGKNAPAIASPSFIYGYDPAAVSAHIAGQTTSTEVQIAAVNAKGGSATETKTLITPAGSQAGITWSLSPSGKAVGVFTVVAGPDAQATRDAAFAMLKQVADDAAQREKLFVKPEAYDAIPGLRQMLIDAGGVEASYPNLGTAIEMKAASAANLSAALASDTMHGLKVSISEASDYLKYDHTAFEKLTLDPPKALTNGHAWKVSGATHETQAVVALANDGRRAEWTGLIGGDAIHNPLVAAAALNWLAEQGVEELRISLQVIAVTPLFDKFLLANGARVEGNELVLDAKSMNAARIHLTKNVLPVLLGGKALPYSVIDEMAANGMTAVEAGTHLTITTKGTARELHAAIQGSDVVATITRSDGNIYWSAINAKGATAGGRRAGAATHLRQLVNDAAQDGGVRRIDIDMSVIRDVPQLRAVFEKYGATEVGGPAGYLSLDRSRVLKLRSDLEAEFADLSPAGKSYIGQQAAAIVWPATDDLTEVRVALSGQTAKNVFTDKAGNQWLFKPGDSGRGAATDKAVAELAQMLGLNVPPVRLYTLNVGGKEVAGSLQKMLPGAKSIHAISDLTPSQQAEMLKHSILDWVTNNDDAHIGNWLIDDNGRLWSIDKSRSWSTLNDGLHDTLKTTNEGNGGGTPLMFKFWRDVKTNPKLLAGIKPQDLAPVLRALRNMPDEEFRRIVQSVADVTKRGKYASKPDAMVKAMLDRKNSAVADIERYFKGELDALVKARPGEVPEVWRRWAAEGGRFNLDATPRDLLVERLTEREARFGEYSPSKFSQLTQDAAFSKVRSQVHSYYDGGISGTGAGRYGAELIRPRLTPKAEQDWRELNEWATLSIILKDKEAVNASVGYGIEALGVRTQAELLRKVFNEDTGTIRLVRSTNRYKVGGRADVPQAYIDGIAKDGIRNLSGYAMGKHVVVAAHGGVYYYADLDPGQVFTWWGLGHGAGEGESEVLVSDVRPDQIIAIRPQTKPLPNAGLGYTGPITEAALAALAGMLS